MLLFINFLYLNFGLKSHLFKLKKTEQERLMCQIIKRLIQHPCLKGTLLENRKRKDPSAMIFVILNPRERD